MSTQVSPLPRPGGTRRTAPHRLTFATPTRRRIAKGGMLVCLGVLVWSALAGRRVLRRYHVLAGVTLLGFTAWHLSLYKPPDEDRRRRD